MICPAARKLNMIISTDVILLFVIELMMNIRQKKEITIDTIDAHYWNYKVDPKKLDQSWGDSIYTDFVTVQQAYAFTADAVRKRSASR